MSASPAPTTAPYSLKTNPRTNDGQNSKTVVAGLFPDRRLEQPTARLTKVKMAPKAPPTTHPPIHLVAFSAALLTARGDGDATG